ncbi:WD40 repeat domain-containing protein [uncultured Gimesia sp.]|uniref:WD40 repeat domain-containing protein n=1 Tax=uncultured Gimesia sp. TaxID=1678688 RepID=UPI002607A444|nr:WD40 repeat domain-containing protein [uncultured Gimesia sp.]
MRITAAMTICSLCIISLECINAEEQQREPLIINKPFRIFNTGHKKSVLGIAFSPNGKLLASASDVAQLRDLSTGKVLMTIVGSDVGYFDVKFAPDGKTLALPGFYGNIQIWNVKTNKIHALLKGHDGRVFSVDYNSNGKFLASGGGPNGMPGQMKVWKLATGNEVTDLDKEHPAFVNSVAFSPNGKILASASRNLVRFWNVETGVLMKTFQLKETNKKLHIFALAFSPDGKLLAAGGSNTEIYVWDLKTGSLKYRLSGHADNITSLAFAPDGKSLASAGSYDHTARIWNLISGKLVVTFKTLKEDVDCVAFSPDGKLLAAGGGGAAIGDPGIVFLWKVPSSAVTN